MEELLSLLVVVLVSLVIVWAGLAVFGGLISRWRNGRVTVFDHEAGLKIDRGALVATLGPGVYRTWPGDIQIERVDLRPRSLNLMGQEILTADTLAVRISALVQWRVTDAARFRAAHETMEARLYEIVQLAVRARVAARTLDAIVTDRGALAEGMAAEIGAITAEAGLEVLSAEIRDVILVGPAKQAFADLWKAQKEGQAALERARGEQASLRALANAARMLKGNPELMNLRVLAALAGRPGAPAPHVVLGGAAGLVPVGAVPDAPGAAPAELE